MNLPHTVISDSIVSQPSTPFNNPSQFPPSAPWDNNNEFHQSYQLPLQLSQYYNVFPDVPSTKTSWTFPNGCVTSNIVRFTGNPTPSSPILSREYKSGSILPVKRKSLTLDNEPQPNKIFITDEKMAARMSGMHISNDFVSHNTCDFGSSADADIDSEILEFPQKNNSEPQLVVCDELKNLSKDMDSIIPDPLIPFEKPSTALVLWRPPMSYLNVVQIPREEEYPTRSSVIITDITDRPDLDNNNISTVDLNTLLNPPSNDENNMEIMEM